MGQVFDDSTSVITFENNQYVRTLLRDVPDEVADLIRKKVEGRELIHSEDVSDLHYVDISKNRYRYVKRLLDVVISAIAIVVLLIPSLVLMVAIYIDDPGDVIFRQYRVGEDGKRFRFYKFRSMRMDTPKYLSTSDVDDPDKYITRIGKFLRKSSIDELPQLLNVLKGDMSIIGPRPLISDEVEIHEMRKKFGVYSVRPGISGWAQVRGRDTVSPTDKVRLDVQYLENFGLRMDMKILIDTIPRALAGKGVAEGFGFGDDTQKSKR